MMVVKNINNKNGQAIFELLAFVPFMLIFYALSVMFYNAINGSINQQKITRGYLFARVKNNSNFPSVSSLLEIQARGEVGVSGMYMLGYREKFVDGETPKAPCYKLVRISAGAEDSPNDNCEDSFSFPGDATSRAEITSQFIRVNTAYGICGNTYSLDIHQNWRPSRRQGSAASCLNLPSE